VGIDGKECEQYHRRVSTRENSLPRAVFSVLPFVSGILRLAHALSRVYARFYAVFGGRTIPRAAGSL
jgi:hypothetical protein